MSRRKKKTKKRVKVDNLEQINANAAGLDIGAEEIWACVSERRIEENVRRFDTFTANLNNFVFDK